MKYKLVIEVTRQDSYVEEKTFEGENIISTSDAIQRDNLRQLFYINNIDMGVDESKFGFGDIDYKCMLHVIDDNFQVIDKINVDEFFKL